MTREVLKRRLSRGIALLAALLLAAVIVLVWQGRSERLGQADVGLVLGSKVYADGTPSPRTKARLDMAIALYNRRYFKTIIVSGNVSKDGVPEGTAMKDYLVRSGVLADDIIADNKAVNTYDSVRNTVRLLKERDLKSVFVVTQYFHLPRARLALGRFGIEPVYYASPSYSDSRDIYSTLRELPAYMKYLLRSYEEPES